MSRTKLEYDLRVNVVGGKAIGDIVAKTRALREESNLTTAQAQKQGTMTKRMAEASAEGARVLDVQSRAMDRARKNMDPLSKGHRILTTEIQRNQRAVKELNDASKELDVNTVRQNTRLKNREKLIKDGASMTKRLALESKALAQGLQDGTISYENAERQYDKLNQSAQKLIATNDQLASRVGITREEKNKLAQQTQSVTSSMQGLESGLRDVSTGTQRAEKEARKLISDMGLLRSQMRAGTGDANLQQAQYQALRGEYQRMDKMIRRLVDSQKLDEAQKKRLIAVSTRLNTAMTSTSRTQAGVAEAFTGTTKVTNSANQILLSFGDILQDSSQFQYGFALGMRAIGNNLSFVSEQFLILASKIKAQTGQTASARDVMRELVGSFRGVGGIIVAINIAITAFTILSERMRRNKKDAEGLTDTIDIAEEAFRDYAEAIKAVAEAQQLSESEMKFMQASLELGALRGALDESKDSVKGFKEEAKDLDKQMAPFEAAMAGARGTAVPLTGEMREEYDLLLEQAQAVGERIATEKEFQEVAEGRIQTLEKQVDQEARILDFRKRIQAEVGDPLDTPEDEEEDREERRAREVAFELESRSRIADIRSQFIGDEVTRQQELFKERQIRLEDALKAELMTQREYDVLKKELDLESSEFEFDLEREKQQRILEAQDQMARLQASQTEGALELIESEYEAELAILERKFKDKLLLEEEYNAAVDLLNQERANREEQVLNDSLAARRQAYENLANIALGGAELIFGKTKALAIAEALISTYFSAQKAYESQVKASVDPKTALSAPLRGALAAGAAIVQGLARVQQIRKINLNSASGSGGKSGGSGTGGKLPTPESGFSTSGNFVPRSPERSQEVKLNVVNKLDRRGLALLVRSGNADIDSSAVRTRSR